MRRLAKRVIWLSMAGGPSHLETFDYKPELKKQDGQPMPEIHQGKADRAAAGGEAELFRPAAGVQEARRVRGRDLRAVRTDGNGCVDEMCNHPVDDNGKPSITILPTCS